MSATTEWRRFRTSELIEQKVLAIGDGYRAKNSELDITGIPFARAGNINEGFKFDDADLFPEANLQKIGEKISRPGDVVFTSKGTVGRFAFVRMDTPRFVYSPQLCYWRSLDSKRIDPRYLFYWMQGGEFWEQSEGVKGQTDMADYVSLGDQRRMFLTLPPLSEQRSIARILGTLDNKIELNRHMNRTLESTAQVLFRSWFVDFEPVSAKREGRKPVGMDDATAALFPEHFQETDIGPIPTGWDISSIGMIADVIDCLHSKKPDRLPLGKPLLQLSNIRDDGLLDPSDLYLISEYDYDKWVSRMEAQQGDCVITNVGRVGAVSQIPPGIKAALGRNITGIRCKASHPFPTFLIQCLLSAAMRDEIVQKTDAGTILDALNVKNIPLLRFILPSTPLLEIFEKSMRPIRAKMEHNFRVSLTLGSLRDTLLPQLLSGELRVGQTEKIIEEVS